MLLFILTVKKLFKRFMKKNYKKQTKTTLELKKLSREKMLNYMLNRKAMPILLTVALIKKT